ncbi:peptide-binding protein [Parapedobacter pyrenivorans]|uniref:Peptide-binding protein n=1 Tax=Parapedobacter pyrenivorans TaxID=1305674 RepID=A0A917MBG4_9SPHI|nr:PDZ domain-containing protein [Parapedobacter pyrenivorans]GGG89443.1 peptide-binding protein [Parapedobacter pyrenivorans]
MNRHINFTDAITWLRHVLLGCGVWALASCGPDVTTYYVAPMGADSAAGTKDRPFGSLAAAKRMVTEKKAAGSTGRFDVVLLPGTYFVSEPLIFGPAESGTTDAPYTIRAEAGGDVVLSAGVPLQVDWQQHDGRIWKTHLAGVDSIEGLYAGGKALTRARYPNAVEGVYPFGGFAADALAPARIVRWTNPVGGYIHAMHSGRWGGMHYRITGKDAGGMLTYEGGWQNNRPSAMHGTQRFVENIFEELDAPGEWYFDRMERMLYYFPEEDQEIERMDFIAAQLESIIQLKGSEDHPVTDIYIEGITFQHTVPTFMKTREQLMRSDWSIYRSGAVLLDGTERCGVRNSTFSLLGGNAVFVSNYNRQSEISGNLIEYIGGSAIAFVGSADAVRSPSFRYEEFVPAGELDTIPGPKSNAYPADGVAENNLIRYIGMIEKQVAGVQIQLAAGIGVRHNTIYHVPRSGINIGDGAWGGHVIEYNDVFQTVLETGDHGAFNSWGRDRFWHPNRAVMDSLAKVHPNWILLDAVETTIIRNNRFRCDHGWDIDLDDGSSNYAIYNNVCLAGGLKLREGFYRKVYNNILVNNGFHPHVWFESSHDVFTRNIVMTAHQQIQIKHWGDTVDHNFFVDSADLEVTRKYGIERNGVVGDPRFVIASAGDFTLREGADFLKDGFVNISMDDFGVVTERLKAMADMPEITPLTVGGNFAIGDVVQWHGGTLKNMETLGEQSAAGLSEIRGALVLEIPDGSPLARAGIRAGDVILSCDETATDDVIALRKAEASHKWKGRLVLDVWRNQQLTQIELRLE